MCSCSSIANDLSELQDYLNDREICDHLRGEIPDPADNEEAAEVVGNINIYCKDADMRLAKMKQRFAGNQEAMRRLNTLEEHIESKGLPAK